MKQAMKMAALVAAGLVVAGCASLDKVSSGLQAIDAKYETITKRIDDKLHETIHAVNDLRHDFEQHSTKRDDTGQGGR